MNILREPDPDDCADPVLPVQPSMKGASRERQKEPFLRGVPHPLSYIGVTADTFWGQSAHHPISNQQMETMVSSISA